MTDKVRPGNWAVDHPDWWNRFHALWTKAVGTESYSKQEWGDFAEELREMAEVGVLRERILCMNCGGSVSSPVPKGTVVRAWVECPECIEKKGHVG